MVDYLDELGENGVPADQRMLASARAASAEAGR
jgi:hypothetical protein